jgi:hypothetical protein
MSSFVDGALCAAKQETVRSKFTGDMKVFRSSIVISAASFRDSKQAGILRAAPGVA